MSAASVAAMLDRRLTRISEAMTREELLAELVRFANHLEFQTVTATVIVDDPRGESLFSWADNATDAYLAVSGIEVGRRDPVGQHCKRSGMPIVWDQATYTRAGQGERWEEQASYGYRTGIALALHLPMGRHLFVALDRDHSLPTSVVEVTRMVSVLLLFAVCAQDVALRILGSCIPGHEDPLLTTRELECLRWTMEGKTAWELGRILSISEQTAVRHVNNATHKLGCVNKLQAVIKAYRMGLVQ
jgi:DNA-binding CsgD family transcriptional regulator